MFTYIIQRCNERTIHTVDVLFFLKFDYVRAVQSRNVQKL